ncbi:MAG: CHAD domain-containing protein [Leptolyngbya sp.]|nr:CHAD domain-containing protein [Candidatus Melainabacteria bacterium]
MTLVNAPKNGRVKTQPKTLASVTSKPTLKAKAAPSKNVKAPKDDGLIVWVAVESRSLTTLSELAIKELKRLEKSVTAKRIHKARVALRRWSALWKLLRDDGWETEEFYAKVNKPLKHMLKVLGNARDADINLELGKEIKVSKQLRDEWKAHRANTRAELRECVQNLRLKKLEKRMIKFASLAPETVSHGIKNSLMVDEDSEFHFHTALESQERIAQKLANVASSSDDYHQLRLALKQWRYILADVYGAAQNELEIAQAQLGELHDCDRLKELLINSRNEVESLGNLNHMRQLLIAKVIDVASTLPFGYRPKIKI